MTLDGGGWTLVVVSSDDGQNTWTWSNRHYWDTDKTTFGKVTELNKDFKSPAHHQIAAKDVLFVHHPSKVWAAYHGVGNGTQSLAQVIGAVGGPVCWKPTDGHELTVGTLKRRGRLCSSRLYFGAQDWDGYGKCTTGYHAHNSYGPTWSQDQGDGCPFDDPARTGLGPVGVVRDYSTEMTGLGFAHSMGLNRGAAGKAQNYMWVLIREATPPSVCGNGSREGGEECDDGNKKGGDGCSATCKLEAAKSCLALLKQFPYVGDGVYWIQPTKSVAAFQTYCDMRHDAGGWTLAAVSSDDGQDTWTWNNRLYWTTNTKTFGKVTELNKDFKSAALHQTPMKDVLFIHQPSGVWASYHDVGDGKGSLAKKIDAIGGPRCWTPTDGYELTVGTLLPQGNLCSTKLYFNAKDHDGWAICRPTKSIQHAWGPVWSTSKNAGCPFDDPGHHGSLGPDAAPAPSLEYSGTSLALGKAVGFGYALGLNTGREATGQNYMWVFVRESSPVPTCGNGSIEAGEECDDGNVKGGDTCSVQCKHESLPGEVLLKSGTFKMGSPSSEPGRGADERQHDVTLTRGFHVWRTEVTQGEFQSVMGYNPSGFKTCGSTCPVESVTWHEALAFCNALSLKRGLPQCFDCTGSGPSVKCTLRGYFARNAGKDYHRCW